MYIFLAPFPKILATFTLDHSAIIKITLHPSLEGFFAQIHGPDNLSALEELILLWLRSYASGKQPSLHLPFGVSHPPFMQKTLVELQKIPFSEVASYRDIAMRLGNPKAARAIGNICRLNPFPLVIPCHRVVSSNGSLGGFAYPLEIKESLLRFEKNHLKGRCKEDSSSAIERSSSSVFS